MIGPKRTVERADASTLVRGAILVASGGDSHSKGCSFPILPFDRKNREYLIVPDDDF